MREDKFDDGDVQCQRRANESRRKGLYQTARSKVFLDDNV